MTQSERRVDLPPMPLPPELPPDDFPCCASPANGEYREPMGEAREAGLVKRNQERLARAQQRDHEDSGLHGKYHVERLRDPEGKHDNCPYFVLDLRHDPYARTALLEYIRACEASHQGLARDLRALWLREEPKR